MWSIHADMRTFLTALVDGLFRVSIRTEAAPAIGDRADGEAPSATVTTEVDLLTGDVRHARPTAAVTGDLRAMVAIHDRDRGISDDVRAAMGTLIKRFLHLEGELDQLPDDEAAAAAEEGST